MAPLDVGPYRPGEEGAILDCLAACFGFVRDAETWRHVYLENPAGAPIVVLAREGATVVCHESLVPKRLVAFGESVLGADSLWAMTRVAWRRQGLGQSLALRARTMAIERDVRVIYGFSNEQVIRRVVRGQGRQAVHRLPVLVRMLQPLSAFRAWWRSPSTGMGGDLSEAAWTGWTPPVFDARHDALARDLGDLPPIALTRDRAYLAWRYPSVPNSRYRQRQLGGDRLDAAIMVRVGWERGLRAVLVMEWLWRRGCTRAALGLLRDAIARARVDGVHAVVALAMPGTPQRALLRRLAFLPLPGFLVPAHLMLTVEPLADPGDPRWTAPASWYLTFGDGDAV